MAWLAALGGTAGAATTAGTAAGATGAAAGTAAAGATGAAAGTAAAGAGTAAGAAGSSSGLLSTLGSMAGRAAIANLADQLIQKGESESKGQSQAAMSQGMQFANSGGYIPQQQSMPQGMPSTGYDPLSMFERMKYRR